MDGELGANIDYTNAFEIFLLYFYVLYFYFTAEVNELGGEKVFHSMYSKVSSKNKNSTHENMINVFKFHSFLSQQEY